MGNLFHEPVGDQLTKENWESTGANLGKHLFGPTVAVGDLPYAATSATTGVALSTLPIGASGTILTVSAGVPSWNNTLNGNYTVNGTMNITGNATAAAFTANSLSVTGNISVTGTVGGYTMSNFDGNAMLYAIIFGG